MVGCEVHSPTCISDQRICLAYFTIRKRSACAIHRICEGLQQSSETITPENDPSVDRAMGWLTNPQILLKLHLSLLPPKRRTFPSLGSHLLDIMDEALTEAHHFSAEILTHHATQPLQLG